MFWQDLYGPFLDHGITFEEVRVMTLHEVALAHGYWKRNPPLRILAVMIAKALGIEFPDPQKANGESKYMTPQEAAMLMRITDGKIPGVGQAFGP